MDIQKAIIEIGLGMGLDKDTIKRVCDTNAALIRAKGTTEPRIIIPEIRATFTGERLNFALMAYGAVIAAAISRKYK